jgi:hypothetical protein
MKARDRMPPAANLPGSRSAAALAVPATNGKGANGEAHKPAPMDNRSKAGLILDHLIAFFTSLRLAVACLALGMILVFWGTLAQVDLGLLKAQNEFFRSFFVYWGPKGASWKIPVFPGGYLVGGVLLINLVASHFKRFSLTRKKTGIWLIHFGLILLLLGQLATDLLSRESFLHLREGQSKNYSESDRQFELAIIDTSDAQSDKVVAIPEGLLMRQKEIGHPELPFTVRVHDFLPNSVVQNRATNSLAPPAASRDIGSQATVREVPRETQMDRRDRPSAVVELMTPEGSQGTWLVSDYVEGPQTFSVNNRSYEMVMRLRRYYKPFSIQLLKFTHEVYPGTDTPKNFASRVQVQNPQTGENREVQIYMNNPLRYAGETFYQASLDPDDHGTVLEVVHNPSWLTPYFSCVLVGLGLLVQFAAHLFGFAFKRKTA